MIQITSASTMLHAVREMGLVPFFAGKIPGFSIQEMTPRGYWFDGDEDPLGPWDWKIDCIRSGEIAYGKFLWGGKAAFATVEWYRELRNCKRARLQPDAAGEEILAYLREHGTITIKEVRNLLGVKKTQADAAISRLMNQCRVVTGDITRVYRGPNLTYNGWQVSSFCMPEDLFQAGNSPFTGFPGFPFAEAGDPLATEHTPEQSQDLLVRHIQELFPGTPRETVLKCLA